MDKQDVLRDLQTRLTELLRASPAADVERNVRALLAGAFQRLELVTRDELDAQMARLAALSQRIDDLERRLRERDTPAGPGPA